MLQEASQEFDAGERFARVTPEELFDLYMDPKKHAAAIGGPVDLIPKVGGRFAAYGGLVGRFLLIDPPGTIAQTWRANVWRKEDPGSVLVLNFTKIGSGARVQLVQINVPDHASRTIDEGWQRHYWDKWPGRSRIGGDGAAASGVSQAATAMMTANSHAALLQGAHIPVEH